MFPEELTRYPQWVLWRSVAKPNGEYTKLPYSAVTGGMASVTDPRTWAPYPIAVEAAKRLLCGIGFVLTENDPFAFIDLDNPCGNQAIIQRQMKIEEAFQSYSELSPSKTGLHIICKGAVTRGRRREKVEVYSSLRFMTMTGDTYRDLPIADRSDLLRVLWEEIGGADDTDINVYETPQKYEDEVIYNQAAQAANGDKFLALWEGRWLDVGYASQSEADFALINILSFYSRNMEQIKRMFYLSALGKRDKAKRKSYVDKMIQRSFDNQPPFIDLSEIDKNLKAELVKVQTEPSVNPFAGPLFANVPDPDYDYTTPPGLLGEIAQYIYDSSARQVKEIALAASIGLMAGICGRAYNISNTGLNQYILLLSGTGRGKEGMVTGIDRIMREIQPHVPAAMDFIGPTAIASGQALIRHLSSKPCFVSIVGEFGLMLQAMCSFSANSSQITLRKTLLELYMKSGHTEVLRSTIYSDKDKNTPIVASPSFSLLGESTPSTYYEGLDETMISQGLLPRFLCIEHKGKVPYLNKQHASIKPSAALITKVTELCVNCLTLMANSRVVPVTLDPEAQEYADEFSRITTDRLNTSEIILAQELWNRAHLKVLKLSALLAVGSLPYAPVVTLEMVKWAQQIVERDITNMFAKFEAGEIGNATNETNQVNDAARIIKDYLTRPFDARLHKYKVDPVMHGDRVISLAYLQRKLLSQTPFKNDRLGATNALKRCIESFVNDGSLREVRQIDMQARYRTVAKGFAVVDLNRFIGA